MKDDQEKRERTTHDSPKNSHASAGRKSGENVSEKDSTTCARASEALIEKGAPHPIPDEDILYDLADLFKVFGDSTRIKILYALMEQNLCVAHLAIEINMTQSAVSHQLRTLKQAHLIKFERDGKNIIYSLADDHVYTMLAQGMDHIRE